MKTMILGRTGIVTPQTGFGALPIQRVSMDEAEDLLRAAYAGGIRFFDTARGYSDSEEKIGRALAEVRASIFLATKTMAKNAADFHAHLATSLALLQTDYIDLYQFHNPSFVPRPGGADGLYDAALEARAQGKIRFLGITQHSLVRAREAVESGLYDTLQFPFNHLATEEEIALVRLCAERNVGFIAMKALSGGLITDARTAFAYLSSFDNVLPIWGMQRMEELDQFLALSKTPPILDAEIEARIAEDRAELSGAFCRGCGYCQPCPAQIPIQMANRMVQLIRRSPSAPYFSSEWQAYMEKINDCTQCGACEARCPYGLKPYETLPAQYRGYREIVDAQRPS